jgi:hypothetical protein
VEGPETVRAYLLQSYPTFLLFRSESVNVTVHFEFELDDIQRLSGPLFARLGNEDLSELCYESCIVHIGAPSEGLRRRFFMAEDVRLTWIPAGSAFARAIKGEDSDVFELCGRNRTAVELDADQLKEGKVVRLANASPRVISTHLDSSFLLQFIVTEGMDSGGLRGPFSKTLHPRLQSR